MSDFTDDQVDRAIDHVKRHGAPRRGATVFYSDVFEAAGMAGPHHLYNDGDGRVVTKFMEAFHERCLARGLPPLDSLVVNAGGARGGLPGIGYFRINDLPDPAKSSTGPDDVARSGAFLEAQRTECHEWVKAQRGSGRSEQD